MQDKAVGSLGSLKIQDIDVIDGMEERMVKIVQRLNALDSNTSSSKTKETLTQKVGVAGYEFHKSAANRWNALVSNCTQR